ncbi:ATP-binding cassette domain-containing protein [Nocardia sp. NPDC050710]|uniref:ATP-binding cassette domain-containing protein n=1 Tax=Nocardia sp. NPDC050710 TaxID=3157220 RepID=UPI0033EF675B
MIKARELERIFQPRRRRGDDTEMVHAVKGVTFDVAEGEIVSCLGPNGAGKTTTLRMLTTLLRPTSGEALVAGFDIATDSRQVRRNIGYVSQAGATNAAATAIDEVIDHAMLYGLSKKEAHRSAGVLFGQLDLEGLEARQCKSMSGGQRRRLDLAIGMVHGPRLMILDEPTVGLDPQSRANLWDHIRRLRAERQVTVLLTTHYLDEADALSDRVIVIDDGRIIADDTPQALKARHGEETLDMEVMDMAMVANTVAVISTITGSGDHISVEGYRVRASVGHGRTNVQQLMRQFEQAGVELRSVSIHPPTLDNVFLQLTGRSLREDRAGGVPA